MENLNSSLEEVNLTYQSSQSATITNSLSPNNDNFAFYNDDIVSAKDTDDMSFTRQLFLYQAEI